MFVGRWSMSHGHLNSFSHPGHPSVNKCEIVTSTLTSVDCHVSVVPFMSRGLKKREISTVYWCLPKFQHRPPIHSFLRPRTVISTTPELWRNQEALASHIRNFDRFLDIMTDSVDCRSTGESKSLHHGFSEPARMLDLCPGANSLSCNAGRMRYDYRAVERRRASNPEISRASNPEISGTRSPEMGRASSPEISRASIPDVSLKSARQAAPNWAGQAAPKWAGQAALKSAGQADLMSA
ncbi:unnamed protein product [Nesidiocoris tenuis]|uniref:Uncharacterized protein n=1 Tax=Nesidiocoris tenuis TaxID=355587 RepID=A0A6H5FYL4_9HEMI|nr:unnamed protein product [Nesidiocoris tenuis]